MSPSDAFLPAARRRRLVAGLPALAFALSQPGWRPPAHAQAGAGGDPLGTSQWPGLRQEFIGDAPMRFSDEVHVQTPTHADDAMHVPVLVDARSLVAGGGRVERIRLVVDRNPIRHVLDYEPLRALPVLTLRLRMQQASPVRALVRTQDGHWHVGGAWVQAAGGGCTLPGASRNDGSWSRTLNQVQARLFGPVLTGSRRLRLRIAHPMDTGFVPGVPAFHLEQLALLDAAGRPWWRMALHEPVSENPLFGFELPPEAAGPLRLVGQDNNGNRIDTVVAA